RGAGVLEISCRRDGNVLALRVWNTAGGDEEGPSDHSHGIGLSNIRERLDLIYGENYRFSRERSADGFEVRIRLPIQKSTARSPFGTWRLREPRRANVAFTSSGPG